MTLKDHIGKIRSHPLLGEVEVLGTVPNSRTKLTVKVIDRGPGYDHDRKRYTGVRVSTGWMRGQNYQYGFIDDVHHKDLTKIKEDG